ncbi:hypothetical protein WJ048_05445 [Listeria welshimeri]|uniref:Uncharacterized protein n=1 Tax=Listeria welshimeri serovar 6b (strain ATCC 35897 / DSM 20650 / CCUG 15529 / CIP 8149 / NCTC 11857 / SLCC 5334 / V8) TaxID=386043 RepID=A0AHL1_LISW6|nr:hypothetical protein [Listeria welshimeri]MBC1409361.1 hypothetical protein [Listeria welshimeri]MBC1663002.1 hypothetical protein [Listeria welshimeri]MBC1954865.1 hypothetical protein [Listeria welshimeri]MBF2466746.1 hypothetical protein [Listeria welshimeri]MBF2685463.1 hypothetical protein [Listeria welshimeri]
MNVLSDIRIADKLMPLNFENALNDEAFQVFGKEYFYLKEHGYEFDSKTSEMKYKK